MVLTLLNFDLMNPDTQINPGETESCSVLILNTWLKSKVLFSCLDSAIPTFTDFHCDFSWIQRVTFETYEKTETQNDKKAKS